MELTFQLDGPFTQEITEDYLNHRFPTYLPTFILNILNIIYPHSQWALFEQITLH